MELLQALDLGLFRFINASWSNGFFDALMPFLSYNSFFIPGVALVSGLLIWKGGLRGLICVIAVLLIVAVGDGQIIRPLKLLLERQRPFAGMDQVNLLVGKGESFSMPSAHAANWFAALTVMFIYYRRSVWVMLPAALAVSFSRIYNGAHYPSDVLVGAVLGAGYGAGMIWGAESLWQWGGQRWFPLWHQRLPSLVWPRLAPQPEEDEPQFAPRGAAAAPAVHAPADVHWMRFGYTLIGLLLFLRLAYIASDTIQLSEDEAYQWVWSKYPALSYYSKPPLIAYTQWAGTHLWGDTEFGVRFFSPVIAAIISLLLLRFLAVHVNPRAAVLLLVGLTATLLMGTGSLLLTVDPLSVLFWTAAMFAGWRAVKENARPAAWFWVGLWTGLGFLSKYTALFQLLCWALFFWLHPPARVHLRRAGPYLALGVLLICAIPVLAWNAQHDWITVRHVADDAGVNRAWKPTLRYLGEFLGAEFALLNPVFFVATVWACVAFWKRGRRNPLLLYFFSMGAPVFIIYLLLSFRSRVHPNWIAPSVLPLFCLALIYWDQRWRLGQAQAFLRWFTAALVLGGLLVTLALDTNLVRKWTGYDLPTRLDPLRRVRGWQETARAVAAARSDLLQEGAPVFIIGDHYGITSQIGFYYPEARETIASNRLVYHVTTSRPVNQYYFWPGYTNRTGHSAIFVTELGKDLKPRKAPSILTREFASVEDLGTRKIHHRGKVMRVVQLFACRDLR